MKEKHGVALSSVIAAVGLTTFKIIVGILTGSLGIIAEATHSALDLVAAMMTLLAVRISGKPADDQHLYGHGKVENLSALFETLLLLATCAWIIYEAVQRMFFRPIKVEVSIWAFIVMSVSIIIDISRSKVLYKTARKYNSQALEADALHFSTDIWSSAVVILGLILIKVSEILPELTWLEKADAAAALGVAVIVIYVSIQLGSRTIMSLIDTAPKGSVERVMHIVESIRGVKNCHAVRIRTSGPRLFIDAHVLLDGKLSLSRAHKLTETIEKTIQKEFPDSDVIVHPEPINVRQGRFLS